MASSKQGLQLMITFTVSNVLVILLINLLGGP